MTLVRAYTTLPSPNSWASTGGRLDSNTPLLIGLAMILIHRVRRVLAAMTLLTCGLATTAETQAAGSAQSDKTRENLMVVVRESEGANKQDEIFVPSGKTVATLPDGREVEIHAASWEFIGDMHIRFVFDQPQTMIGATPEDFERLKLASVDQALELALANVRRVYGEPGVSPWTAGLMAVHGQSPDLNSSYILDRDFWRAQLKEHPEGLIVAVPKRGGLLYAPLSDHAAVDGLKKGIGALHASSGRLRVSSALYLFKGDKWSVFQSSTAH